jgi:hypothetical protein
MSARDAAVEELVNALGLERDAAAAIVDRLVHAAAVETGARIGEALCEPLAVAVTTHADAIKGLLAEAHKELAGDG